MIFQDLFSPKLNVTTDKCKESKNETENEQN